MLNHHPSHSWTFLFCNALAVNSIKVPRGAALWFIAYVTPWFWSGTGSAKCVCVGQGRCSYRWHIHTMQNSSMSAEHTQLGYPISGHYSSTEACPPFLLPDLLMLSAAKTSEIKLKTNWVLFFFLSFTQIPFPKESMNMALLWLQKHTENYTSSTASTTQKDILHYAKTTAIACKFKWMNSHECVGPSVFSFLVSRESSMCLYCTFIVALNEKSDSYFSSNKT